MSQTVHRFITVRESPIIGAKIRLAARNPAWQEESTGRRHRRLSLRSCIRAKRHAR